MAIDLSSLRGRIPIVLAETMDEQGWVTETVTTLHHEFLYDTWVWSPILGLRESERDGEKESLRLKDWNRDMTGEPGGVLAQFRAALTTEQRLYKLLSDENGVALTWAKPNEDGFSTQAWCLRPLAVILTGIQPWIDQNSQMFDPLVVRALYELIPLCETATAHLIIPVRDAKIPPMLTDCGILLEDKLPSRAEIGGIWDQFASDCEEVLTQGKCPPTEELKDLAVERMTGLSMPRVKVALREVSIRLLKAADDPQHTDGKKLLLEYLWRTKAQVLRESAALELVPSVPFDELGGVPLLKEWLKHRVKVFTPEAKAAGIPRPKGCLLLGPPGGGKSWCAKVTSAIMDLPLIRLDMGAIFGGLVGESEGNVRGALKVVEATAPCVLMIDELEKAFGGAGGQSTDGGTTQRVFGHFLTWMQERESDVFVIATANDVSKLPPELLRKGRSTN